jgi:hypothetical protein
VPYLLLKQRISQPCPSTANVSQVTRARPGSRAVALMADDVRFVLSWLPSATIDFFGDQANDSSSWAVQPVGGRPRPRKENAIIDIDAATVAVVVALRSARSFLLAPWRLMLEGVRRRAVQEIPAERPSVADLRRRVQLLGQQANAAAKRSAIAHEDAAAIEARVANLFSASGDVSMAAHHREAAARHSRLAEIVHRRIDNNEVHRGYGESLEH